MDVLLAVFFVSDPCRPAAVPVFNRIYFYALQHTLQFKKKIKQIIQIIF